MLEGYFSLEDADNEQSNFVNELKNIDKGIKTVEKKFFLESLGLLLVQEKTFLIVLKADYFQLKKSDKFLAREIVSELTPEPTKHKKQLKTGAILDV